MPEDASPTPTIQSALRDATARLTNHTDSPRADATVLLCDCLGVDHSVLITHSDRALDPVQNSRFRRACERRAQGEPVAYITGRRAFWNFELDVNPHTLIPRPDTETLVEQALSHLPQSAPLRVLDLGTGSGAVAIALASERPACVVTATDISADTLRVAQRNAERVGVKIVFKESDWFNGLSSVSDAPFDIIVSNPPYIAQGDPHLDRGDLRAEPQRALVAGPDGLADIRTLIQQAQAWLVPAGVLLLEHGFDQAEAVTAMMTAQGLTSVCTVRDLGDNPRVTFGRKAK